MKTAKQVAKLLNDQHMAYSAGFYSDRYPRCFNARVRAGKLEVSDFDTWYVVTETTAFRDHNGRALFTYSPEPQA